MPNKQWHPVFVTALKEALSDAPPGQVEIQAEVALSSKPLAQRNGGGAATYVFA
ncbi:Uncharacterized [Moorella glycerini]|uniref:Uncharacterized protein n=1 Tax=Neomoorella stamsii TaxID=1266720 RepID=A0A9X7P518_9FIRM|nr:MULTISPECIES: hypothetical protein [Moorella]PRR69972.1 hypothetical protein MOST_28490 [Moorella stamsii]CEP68477.1 Uncharacterized [Moorella glycerini]